MQDYDLKYPGINQQANTVRRNVAVALSNANNEVNPTGELAAFLLDAATKAPKYVKPAPDPLPANQAILADAATVSIRDSTNVVKTTGTAIVAANAVTGVKLIATASVIKNGDTVTLEGKTYTFVVAGGKITGISSADA